MKEVKLNKGLLITLIPVSAVVVAIILSAFLSGAVWEYSDKTILGTIEVVSSVSVMGLIFGGGPNKVVSGEEAESLKYNGGMSIFGLIAFILAVVAVVLLVVAFVKGLKSNKYCNLLVLGGILAVVLSAVCMLLLLVAGTEVSSEVLGMTVTSTFKESFKEYSLGIGAILWSVITLVGAGASAVLYFLDVKAK